MQERQERTRVQMSPCPLLTVVIDRQLDTAVRAQEPGPAGMFHPHIHAPVPDRQLHPAHLPRGNQSQQMAVQLGVTHTPILAPPGESTPDPTHGKLRSAKTIGGVIAVTSLPPFTFNAT